MASPSQRESMAGKDHVATAPAAIMADAVASAAAAVGATPSSPTTLHNSDGGDGSWSAGGEEPSQSPTMASTSVSATSPQAPGEGPQPSSASSQRGEGSAAGAPAEASATNSANGTAGKRRRRRRVKRRAASVAGPGGSSGPMLVSRPRLVDVGLGSASARGLIKFSSEPEDYELEEQIGSGASSKVYWATYTPPESTNQVVRLADADGQSLVPKQAIPVAIKVIQLDSLDIDLARVSESLRSASIMHHHNLLEQHTSFVVGSELWIVTDRADMGSIRDVLVSVAPSGILDESVIAAVLYQALSGLAYLHASDLIHRDIKSSNLLLAADGRVLVADLGAARLSWGAYSRSRTLAGSPCFMAPEVLQVVLEGSTGYDTKADIWSLGIMAIELATGQPPYYSASILQIMAEHTKGPPDLKSTLTRRKVKGRKFSGALRSFVHSCLRINPAERKSAKDLLRHKLFASVRRPTQAEECIRTKFLAKLPSESLAQRFQRMLKAGFTDSAASPVGSANIGLWRIDSAELDSPTASGGTGTPVSAPATAALASADLQDLLFDTSDVHDVSSATCCDLSSFDSDASDFLDDASDDSGYTYTDVSSDDPVAYMTPTATTSEMASETPLRSPSSAESGDDGTASDDDKPDDDEARGTGSGDSWDDW
ncbi:STE/STE20/FRAY protein kinase [Thecamonas trahens ATCC 50062]|uniref:STE/STE20/FRAY protein kinase n=1 Tax=Thecamonas trahens ATCC 50062 TaxID=461836 RepID=A0A0L0DGF4_THETB|nr:STE/STE20/FRAY protein kinase [Thecamonas trahens ATCC 50062]KNC51201.1 STE/STE20/FRAY protein kinase [Thecamonas trahens ATCC 50062]|eukprot:XP_013756400.1 STE/STE20/FRAY protein kinase [Thecamonas trahens ATCC 50062]